MKKKKDLIVYNGGHLLNEAMVMYRNKQHDQLEAIEGIACYSPHKDKSINDKANVVQEALAERILKNDYDAMYNSDVYIFDILNESIGTICELGIILGIKRQAETVLDHLSGIQDKYGVLNEEDRDLYTFNKEIVSRPVYCYCSDIRQGHGKPYNDPDRAEFSTNQFVYGAVLELTNGEGFISWDHILEELVDLGRKGL